MSLNFEDYQTEANVWLNKVAHCLENQGLGSQDRHHAGRIFRAVLHAIRDRLPAGKAAHLGAQLPIIWKGIYYDGFRPNREPVKIRHQQEWLEFICSKDAIAQSADFPTLDDAKLAYDGVMQALHDLLSPGQFEKIRKALHRDIRPEVVD